MRGTSATSGKALEGEAHIKQSIRDILTTPIGSRVMRRDYGSRLLDLIDRPLNPATLLDIYAAVIEALNTWEPRVTVQQVSAARIGAGTLSVSLSCINNETGDAYNLSDISLS